MFKGYRRGRYGYYDNPEDEIETNLWWVVFFVLFVPPLWWAELILIPCAFIQHSSGYREGKKKL